MNREQVQKLDGLYFNLSDINKKILKLELFSEDKTCIIAQTSEYSIDNISVYNIPKCIIIQHLLRQKNNIEIQIKNLGGEL